MYKTYKPLFLQFLRDKWFMFSLAMTCILAYAFFVFNFAPNVEDLAFGLYYGENALLISAGRFGTVILDRILGIYDYRPFTMQFLGIFTLAISAILWCCLLKKTSNGSLSRITYIVFACFYTAAPLMHEALIYTNQALSIPLCFLLVIIALIKIDACEESQLNVCWVLLCLAAIFSIYESLIVVFVAGLVFYFLIRKVYGTGHNGLLVWKQSFLSVKIIALALLVQIALNNFFIRQFQPILPGYYAYTTNYILWGRYPIPEVLAAFFHTVSRDYFVASIFYLPIAIFNACLVLAIFLGIYYTVKTRSWLVGFIFPALIILNFSIPIVIGYSMHYRAMQIIGVFCAIMLTLLAQIIAENRFKIVRVACFFLIFLLLFHQVNDLNKWFFVNHLRYQEDVANFTRIGNELRDNFPPKPTVFVGWYRYSNRVMEHIAVRSDSWQGQWLINNTNFIPPERHERRFVIQTSRMLEGTFANWGVFTEGKDFEVLFDRNFFVLEFMDHLGFEVQEGGRFYERALEYAYYMPRFPYAGYILETEEFIVVNFGI